MKRLDFLRLCTFAGVAGSTGLCSAAQPSPGSDLSSILKDAGLSEWSVSEKAGLTRIRCKVRDFPTFARKAAALGDGKVQAKGNILAFERQGRRFEIKLFA